LELIPDYMLWSTAQTSMRDLPSLMDSPEPSPIHNQDITATPITPFRNQTFLAFQYSLTSISEILKNDQGSKEEKHYLSIKVLMFRRKIYTFII